MTIDSINSNSRTLSPEELRAITQGASVKSGANRTSLDDPLPQASQNIKDTMDLPDLPASMRGISIDSILTAIADEARRNGVASAVEALESEGSKIQTEGEKRLEELRKQIDSLKIESFWDKFVKAFKIIGAVLGVVASVATSVVGGITGNPALIVAGIIGAVMSIDAIVSVASDGKYSMAAGFTELGKKMGMSDSAAQWFGFGMNMGLMALGVVCSLGAASGTMAVSASAQASTALNYCSKIATVTNIATATSGVGSGVASIGQTVTQYQTAQTKAKIVDIDAVLEQLRSNIKMYEDFIEAEMQAASNLMDSVKDIVEDCGETASALLTASPSVA